MSSKNSIILTSRHSVAATPENAKENKSHSNCDSATNNNISILELDDNLNCHSRFSSNNYIQNAMKSIDMKPKEIKQL
jgi:hypothetical protein